jgi:hypothetical protein
MWAIRSNMPVALTILAEQLGVRRLVVLLKKELVGKIQ